MTDTKEKFECQCSKCKRGCKNTPGWFLPGEAEIAAEYLDLSFQEFFDKFLGVNWWVGETEIFVLAPALVGEPTGSEYPGDPRGKCIFFNDEGLCDIHPAKPYECAEGICNDPNVKERHYAVAIAWKNHQEDLTQLLGRKPEAEEFYGGGGLFGGLFQ